MPKVPYTNLTDKIKHVGPCTIWPGQTREVESTHLLEAPVAEAAEPSKTHDEVIAEILSHTVPAIAEMLPVQSMEMLDQLEDAEKQGEGRKGVLTDIAAERLARVDAAKSAEEYAALVADYTLEELQAEYKETTDEGLKGILQAEIEKRNDNGQP